MVQLIRDSLSQKDDGEDIQVGQKLLDQVRVAPELLPCIVLVSRRHFPEQSVLYEQYKNLVCC